MSQVATVFRLDRKGLRVVKGVTVAAAMLVSLIVLTALDLEHYWVTLTKDATSP